MTILLKAIYRFGAMAFFTDLEQKFFEFAWELKRLPNSPNNLEKEEWSWTNHLIISLISDYTTKLQ